MPARKQTLTIGVGMFPKPGGDAAHEFEKIITAGPDAMRQFPKRILPAVRQTIKAEVEKEAATWNFHYEFVRDLLVESASESFGATEEETPGWHGNLIKLRDLLLAIENGLEMSNLTRRVQVFRKLLELFWTVFLVPMLRADGVSKAQAGRRNGNGQAAERQQFAKEMHEKGVRRPKIVKAIQSNFKHKKGKLKDRSISADQARKDCDAAGVPK